VTSRAAASACGIPAAPLDRAGATVVVAGGAVVNEAGVSADVADRLLWRVIDDLLSELVGPTLCARAKKVGRFFRFLLFLGTFACRIHVAVE
jgi:hypothetical protein